MATSMLQNKPRRVLLWENPSTSLAKDAVINLSSSEYECLEVEFVRSNGTAGIKTPFIQRFSKGTDITLTCLNVDANSLTNCFINSRLLTRVTDTQFTASLGHLIRWGNSTGSEASNTCVPLRIYGMSY